ncbi:helix-turn-helix domain-containing protein [Sinosporangium siamense]|nr:helix-turn-helix domain-containing protein [Sinosporangium siamense]
MEDTVAANIRRLREARQMSLSELSRRSGVGKSTLSSLESGTGNPTLQTLWSIAGTLGCALGDLIHEQIPRLLPAGEGVRVDSESTRGRVIARISAGSGVDVYEVTFLAGRVHESSGGMPGMTERLYVVSGEVTAGMPGAEVRLSPGDTYLLPGEPYVVRALSADDAVALMMITRPGGA